MPAKIRCTWIEDENGCWDTSCDNAFEIAEGTPEENHMKFCCYCGRSLDQELYEDEDTN